MTFGQIDIFLTIIEAGSFTQAAQKLGISQSAISHGLRSLEKELQVVLLDRQGRDIHLTAAGQQLLPRFREMQGMAATINQQAAAWNGASLGTVRIGSFGTTSSRHLVPDILAKFRQQYPKIDLEIREGRDQEVISWLQNRQIDLGFITLPDDRFDSVPLIQDQLIALIPSAWALAWQAEIHLSDLCAHPFILTDAGSAELVKEIFSSARLHPKIKHQCVQITSSCALVAGQEGVAIMAEMALPPPSEMMAGITVRYLNPTYPRQIGLAMMDRRALSPAAEAFLRIAQQVFPQIECDS